MMPTSKDIALFVRLLDERDRLSQEDPEQTPSADHGQVVGEGYVPGEDVSKPLIVNMLNA